MQMIADVKGSSPQIKREGNDAIVIFKVEGLGVQFSLAKGKELILKDLIDLTLSNLKLLLPNL
jgi:hypothetical protein